MLRCPYSGTHAKRLGGHRWWSLLARVYADLPESRRPGPCARKAVLPHAHAGESESLSMKSIPMAICGEPVIAGSTLMMTLPPTGGPINNTSPSPGCRINPSLEASSPASCCPLAHSHTVVVIPNESSAIKMARVILSPFIWVFTQLSASSCCTILAGNYRPCPEACRPGVRRRAGFATDIPRSHGQGFSLN